MQITRSKVKEELLLRARISDDFGFSNSYSVTEKIRQLTGDAAVIVYIYENIELKI